MSVPSVRLGDASFPRVPHMKPVPPVSKLLPPAPSPLHSAPVRQVCNAIPPTLPQSARTAHEVAHASMVNLALIPEPWDLSTRLYASLDKRNVPFLMNILRGPLEQLTKDLENCPQKFKEGFKDKKILLAYFLMQVSAAGSQNTTENLNGLRNLLEACKGDLPGIYLQAVYLIIAIQIYEISSRTQFGRRIERLSNALIVESETPQILLFFKLSPEWSGHNLIMYERKFLKHLLEATKKAPYNPKLKDLALSCLTSSNVDYASDSLILKFLLDFLPPAKNQKLSGEDRRKLTSLVLDSIGTFDRIFYWARAGHLDQNPEQWIRGLYEKNQKGWFGLFLLGLYQKIIGKTVSYQFIVNCQNKLPQETMDADQLNLFFRGVALLETEDEELETKDKEPDPVQMWFNDEAPHYIALAAKTLDTWVTPAFFSLIANTSNELNQKLSCDFATLFSLAVNSLDEDQYDIFIPDVITIAQKHPQLFAEVNNEELDFFAAKIPTNIPAKMIQKYLEALFALKRLYPSITLSRDSAVHLLTDRPTLKTLLLEELVGTEWAEVEEKTEPMFLNIMNENLNIALNKEHQNKPSQGIKQDSGHPPTQGAGHSSHPTDRERP